MKNRLQALVILAMLPLLLTVILCVHVTGAINFDEEIREFPGVIGDCFYTMWTGRVRQ